MSSLVKYWSSPIPKGLKLESLVLHYPGHALDISLEDPQPVHPGARVGWVALQWIDPALQPTINRTELPWLWGSKL